MAVIALGQGRIDVSRQRRKAAEVGDPFVVGQGVEAHGRRRLVVAEPQDGLRKRLRPHRIGEFRPQVGILRVGAIGGRDGHVPQMMASAAGAKSRRRLSQHCHPIRTPIAPSTGRMAPEMNAASSEARNNAA